MKKKCNSVKSCFLFTETLRKYPPVKYFTRQSLSEWKIPGKDTILPSGTKVYIPAYAIHHDEKVWPDPEIFDPERFTPEMENARHPMNYLAFGNGPRRCVGKKENENLQQSIDS